MTAHPIDTEALRRLADAATPGPWIAHVNMYVSEFGDYHGAHIPGVADPVETEWNGAVPPLSPADADLIEAYHRAVPALLDENAALRARIKAVRDLHYPAHNNQDRTPFCPDCKGSPGVHECGCWRDERETPVCGHCRGWKGVGPVEWPCPTTRALEG